VLALSPFGRQEPDAGGAGVQLAAQVTEMRAGGTGVETVVPDTATEQLFGEHATDGSLRPPAARAGDSLGRALAGMLAAFWR